MLRYFKRPVESRGGQACYYVVYAIEGLTAQSTGVLQAYAGFPLTYRPTATPGEVFRDRNSEQQYWFCEIHRDQLQRYVEILATEAHLLYPGLREAIPKRRSQSR